MAHSSDLAWSQSLRKSRAGKPNFREEWELSFFFVADGAENARCLLCNRVLSSRKKYPIERHYNTLHVGEYEPLVGDERIAKLEELKWAHYQRVAEAEEEVTPKEEMIIEFHEASAELVNSNDHSLMSEPTAELDRDNDHHLHHYQPTHINKRQKITPELPTYITDALSKLHEIASKKETEFDLWAKSLAVQLNNMELGRALSLQLKIQSLLTEDRISNECNR